MKIEFFRYRYLLRINELLFLATTCSATTTTCSCLSFRLCLTSASTAAISSVFERTSDDDVLRSSLQGFLSIASIASAHGMSDVLDQLVAALCAFANQGLHRELHSPTGELARPLVTFGEDIKACAASRTVFGIAHRFGDVLARGWC